MVTKCPICRDTGRRPGSRDYDCTACDTAEKRVKLNASVEALQGIGEAPEDIWWNVWQMSAEAMKARIAAARQRAIEDQSRVGEWSGKAQQEMNGRQNEAMRQMPYLNNSSNSAACYGYLNQSLLAPQQGPTVPADLEAVRWAFNMLDGMGYGQGPIGSKFMERLQAMLRKV